jgi:hypothetical protein
MSIGTYGEPDAVSNAIGYAKFRGRSHDAVIRVYDQSGNVIETHEQVPSFTPRTVRTILGNYRTSQSRYRGP